jgi:hypothetical protein
MGGAIDHGDDAGNIDETAEDVPALSVILIEGSGIYISKVPCFGVLLFFSHLNWLIVLIILDFVQLINIWGEWF